MLKRSLKASLQIILTGSIFLLMITSRIEPINPQSISQFNIKQKETGRISQSVEELIALLLDDDLETREAAFQRLQELGADKAVPVLIKALENEDWQIKVISAYTLGRFGSEAQAAIPALSQEIKDKNPDVRFVVAQSLGKIGSEAVVPALIQALQDEDENVRDSSAEAFKTIGQAAKSAVPELTRALWDGNWYVRNRSAQALSQLGWDAIDLPTLIEPWQSDNPPNSGAIISLMVAIQPSVLKNPEQIPDFFIESLQDEDVDVRQSAVIALGHFKATSLGDIRRNETINALRKALNDEDAGVRQSAAESFSIIYHLSPKEQSAVVSALIEALKDEDAGVRQSAAKSLGYYLSSEEASVVKSALIDALKEDKDPRVRQSAAESLIIISGQGVASDVKSAFIGALKDDNNVYVRLVIVAKMLGENENCQNRLSQVSQLFNENEDFTDETSDLNNIIQIIQKKDLGSEIRRSAATILFQCAYIKNDWETTQILIQALQDEDLGVRQNIAITLWKNGQLNANDTLSILGEGLRSEDPLIQFDAINGIAIMGKEAKPALNSLILLLQEDIPLRYAAALAITNIDPQEKSLPILGEILKNDNKLEIIGRVYSALETIGSPKAFSTLIESWESKESRTYFTNQPTNQPRIGDGFLNSDKAYLIILQSLKNEKIRSSIVKLMTPDLIESSPVEEQLLISSHVVNIVVPKLIRILENKHEGHPAFKEIFNFKDRDIRRSAVYALGPIAESIDEEGTDSAIMIIKDKDDKQKIIDAITVVVQNQQEDIDIRWMAATSLQKLRINQDSFFAKYNLTNPLVIKCPFPNNKPPDYKNGLRFDRYSVQCLYDNTDGQGNGFFEIYSELRRRFSRRNTVNK